MASTFIFEFHSFLFGLVILFGILVNLSQCWWDTGHMLVAKVAELKMLEEDKESFSLAEKLTNILNSFSHNKVTNFVESACWPDDVKSFGLESMNEWHFINLPVRLVTGPEITNSNITYKPDDALGTLHQCYHTLTRWTYVEKENLDTQFEKSLMARYLVHVVGDVHQPLHATEFFDNDRFKDGDAGGNLFLIKYKQTIENLHKLFDSGIDKIKNELKRPLTEKEVEYLETTAKAIMEEFKPQHFSDIHNSDFSNWIEESKDFAQDYIYNNIKYDSKPSESFLEESFKLVKKRIALGGYRLAMLFKEVRKAYEEPLMISEDKLLKPSENQHLKFLE